VLASFPGLLHLQFLIACSMQNGGKRPGEFRHMIVAWLSNVITPPLNRQAIYKTDLTFCASYKDGTSASRELHRPFESYPSYKTWLQKAAEWQAWKYLAVTQSRRVKRWHYLELHRLYHSHPSAIKLQNPDMFYR